MMDFLLCTGFPVPPAALLPYGDEVLIDPRLLHQRLMGAPLSDLPIGYDLSLIHILVVEDGRIVQRGTHAELMTQGGLYRRFIEIREQAEGWRLA